MIFLLLLMLAQNPLENARLALPKMIYDSKEIMWFDAAENIFALCLGDGTVICRDVRTGRLLSQFKLKSYIYEQSGLIKLYLSSGQHPRLAVVDNHPLLSDCEEDESDDTGAFVEVITFYDVLNGTVARKLDEQKNKAWTIEGNGFSENGKYFTYLLETDHFSWVSVEVEKSKVLWRLPIDKYGQIRMWPELGIFISLKPSGLKGYDRSEKLIWTKKFGPEIKTPEYCYSQPQGPYAIIEDEQNIFCLSLKDGKTIWTQPVKKGTYLVAVTPDAKHQAFMQDDGLVITSLPDPKKIRVPEVTKKDEVVFVRNGKEFLCLPELAETKEDKKANTVTRARRSNILRVFNTQTGKLLRQFDLAKMKD